MIIADEYSRSFSVSSINNLCLHFISEYKSCAELLNAGFTKDGVYQIQSHQEEEIDAYCDQSSRGGGNRNETRKKSDNSTTTNNDNNNDNTDDDDDDDYDDDDDDDDDHYDDGFLVEF